MSKSIFIAGENSGIGANIVEKLHNAGDDIPLALRNTNTASLVKLIQ